LNGRKEAGRLFEQLQGDASATALPSDEALQPTAPRGDDGKLRHRQQAIDQHQQHDDDNFGSQHGFAPNAYALDKSAV
jgi:hypothetical protein